jgi:hypothetical protein
MLSVVVIPIMVLFHGLGHERSGGKPMFKRKKFSEKRSMTRGKLYAVVLTILLIAPMQSLAASVVGRVLLSKGAVISVSSSGKQTELEKGAEVFLNDTIKTSKGSFMVIKMIDDTKLSIRPNSEVTLDIYSEKVGEESATIGLVKGGLRILTGTIGKKNPEAFLLKTPTSTIGIRGTDFIARLCEDDADMSGQCGNSCAIEEQQLRAHKRKSTQPDSTSTTKQVAGV